MKEHLHLFTPISERLPTENGNYWTNLGERIYEDGNWFYSEEGLNFTTKGVTHWLDLSALTTKHKAADAIEEATKEAYENCEWIYERDAVVKKWIDWL